MLLSLKQGHEINTFSVKSKCFLESYQVINTTIHTQVLIAHHYSLLSSMYTSDGNTKCTEQLFNNCVGCEDYSTSNKLFKMLCMCLIRPSQLHFANKFKLEKLSSVATKYLKVTIVFYNDITQHLCCLVPLEKSYYGASQHLFKNKKVCCIMTKDF